VNHDKTTEELHCFGMVVDFKATVVANKITDFEELMYHVHE
jgi:hypothetical protein